MNPQAIIDAAAGKGVLLYLKEGKLAFYGALPQDWPETVAEWLPYKAAVIAYLENPPWAHRAALARYAADQSRRANGAPCVHRGKLLELKPACGCGPKHECAKHGECVLTGNTKAFIACSRCPDYKAGG